MPNYVIAHGSLKTGKDEYAQVGTTVDLEESFVKAVDPTGVNFVTEEKWLAMKELEELNARIASMSDDEKLEALKAAASKSAPAEAESTPKRRRGAQSEG